MGKLALWERLPKPVRHTLDVGKIVVGLKGLGMIWAIAVSMLPVTGVVLADLPWSLKIPIGIFGIAVTTALTGHVIVWWKRRRALRAQPGHPTTETVREWRKELLAAGDNPLATSAYVEIRGYLSPQVAHDLESGRYIMVQQHGVQIDWRTDLIQRELDKLVRQWRLTPSVPDTEARPDPEAEKARYQRIADTLTKMHDDGVRVLEGCNEVDDLFIDGGVWREEVVRMMRTLGCTDTEVRDIEGPVSYEKMGVSEDAEIERQRSIFVERLKRLKEIAGRYQRLARGP